MSAEDQRRLQQELFDIQKRYEAWGLVLPFLVHPDPNVQFFGAHTIQVKIARDWYEWHVWRRELTRIDATLQGIIPRRERYTAQRPPY